MSTYTLTKDGDVTEKYCWSKFLKTDFPSYEKFWQKFVVPLTNRPKNIHFKNNSSLAKIGKNEKDVCIAQLHYTVLKHIQRVYGIKQTHSLNLDQFMEGIVRLCASLDVADELLERFTSPKNYGPWDEKDGRRARRNWRKNNNQMRWLRNYRNRLLHSRIYPSIVILGTYSRFRVPRFGKETKYLDWREVTDAFVGAGGKVRNDFDLPNNLLNHGWDEVLKYLENNWKKYLK